MDTRPLPHPTAPPSSVAPAAALADERARRGRYPESARRIARPWFRWAVLLLALVPVLAACEISVSGSWQPVDFAVTSASYETNYRAVVNGIEDSVICDDRTTEVTYTFAYSGELHSWRSYFKGVTYGQIVGDMRFVPSDPGVERLGPQELRVTYQLSPGVAPLALGPTTDELAPESTADPVLGPQIVVEPVVLGWSKLHLEVDGGGVHTFGTRRVSDAIPVLQSCGTF